MTRMIARLLLAPALMLAAGLLAKKAIEKGLGRKASPLFAWAHHFDRKLTFEWASSGARIRSRFGVSLGRNWLKCACANPSIRTKNYLWCFSPPFHTTP